MARSRFSAAVVSWFGLTELQRNGWRTYADNIPFSSEHLGTYNLTGQEMYLRTYTAMLSAGLTPVADAPVQFNLGEIDPTITIAPNVTGNSLTITFDDTLSWVDLDNAALQVALSRPFSFTREFNNGPYRVVGAVAGSATVPPTSPANFSGTNVPYTLSEGNLVRAQFRIILDDGRVSTHFFSPITTIVNV